MQRRGRKKNVFPSRPKESGDKLFKKSPKVEFIAKDISAKKNGLSTMQIARRHRDEFEMTEIAQPSFPFSRHRCQGPSRMYENDFLIDRCVSKSVASNHGR